ncbi:MAG: XisI protein [Cyanobacteria bacterium J06629_9]
MAELNYDQIVRQVLIEYTLIPYSRGDMHTRLIVDSEAGSYLLITIGWDGPRRIHGCMVHIDIIGGKVWIQRDDTEDGVTPDLESLGISKDNIVLGFQEPSARPYTGYAIA